MAMHGFHWPVRGQVVIYQVAVESWEGEHMSDQEHSSGEETVPFMQQLLDSPFLLLFLGVALPTLIYIVWGVMEIVAIPVAP